MSCIFARELEVGSGGHHVFIPPDARTVLGPVSFSISLIEHRGNSRSASASASGNGDDALDEHRPRSDNHKEISLRVNAEFSTKKEPTRGRTMQSDRRRPVMVRTRSAQR